FFCCKHCHYRDKCMAALTVDEVPVFTSDDGIDLGRKVVVTLRRPGRNTDDTHPPDHLLLRKRSGGSMGHRRQECNINSTGCQTTPDFMNMRFYPPHVGKVAWRHHQQLE